VDEIIPLRAGCAGCVFTVRPQWYPYAPGSNEERHRLWRGFSYLTLLPCYPFLTKSLPSLPLNTGSICSWSAELHCEGLSSPISTSTLLLLSLLEMAVEWPHPEATAVYAHASGRTRKLWRVFLIPFFLFLLASLFLSCLQPFSSLSFRSTYHNWS